MCVYIYISYPHQLCQHSNDESGSGCSFRILAGRGSDLPAARSGCCKREYTGSTSPKDSAGTDLGKVPQYRLDSAITESLRFIGIALCRKRGLSRSAPQALCYIPLETLACCIPLVAQPLCLPQDKNLWVCRENLPLTYPM